MLEETTHQTTEALPVTANPFVIKPVELNESERVVGIRLVVREDEDGTEHTQTFFHRFRKQERGDVINLFASSATERLSKPSGNRQTVESGNREALRRFWAKYHTGVKGYPQTDDWYVLPEGAREGWRPNHQSMAVNSLLMCEAVINGVEMTRDGGLWSVTVALPNFIAPVHKLTFQVGEWGERQSLAIDKAITRRRQSNGSEEVGINVGLYVTTLLDLVRRVDGCTLDGQTWDENVIDEPSRQRFLQEVYPAWVYRAADELFTRWQVQKRD